MATTTTEDLAGLRLVHPARRPKLVGDCTLGMLLFLFVEVMLFAGLISALTIVKAVDSEKWLEAVLAQPRLPVRATAINSVALLLSGLVQYRSWLAFNKEEFAAAGKLLLVTMLLGVCFVAFQGYEWVGLIDQGLSLRSTGLAPTGAFFYLIVGCHGLHALAALGALAYTAMRLRKGTLSKDAFGAAALFWYFVVLVWPILYFLVYLK